MSMNTGSGARDDPRLARDRGWARWAPQRWASFPVDHRPRPLVLTALDPKVASGCWAPPEPGPPKPFGGLPHRAASAVIDGDGLTLHFTFTGAPPGDAEYPAAEVIETDQALVVLPTAQNVGPPGWRTAIGCARTVITRLTRPLGERVVIDLDASPVMVLPHDPA